MCLHVCVNVCMYICVSVHACVCVCMCVYSLCFVGRTALSSRSPEVLPVSPPKRQSQCILCAAQCAAPRRPVLSSAPSRCWLPHPPRTLSTAPAVKKISISVEHEAKKKKNQAWIVQKGAFSWTEWGGGKGVTEAIGKPLRST